MPGLQDAFDRIGAALEHHLESSHAAGAALAITDREEILGVTVRGLADVAAGTPVGPDTRFQIGSISKSFAGIVALQEAEAGQLDLHVSVNEIVPWLRLPEPFGPITLHHLMQHTAGLAAGTEDAPTLAGALWLLRDVPATSPPGERFWYSNDGWKVVGACLEHVTGTPLHDLLADRLLRPLDMRESTARITEDEYERTAVGYEPTRWDRPPQLRHTLSPGNRVVTNTADGSIVSTVVDMAAYARLLLAGGDLPDERGERILSDAMFSALTEGGVDDGDGGLYAYGLWQEDVDGHRWIAHSGGMVGYSALLAVSPDEGIGLVVLQNGGGSKVALARAALAAVRASLAGDDLPGIWAPPAPTDIPRAREYVGRYRGDDGRVLDVETIEDGLGVTIGSLAVRLERDPLATEIGDTFLVAHAALDRFPLEFGRDDDGNVVEAFHGPTWFRGEDYAGSEPEPLPSQWNGYVGFYRNDSPWNPVLRVLGRKGVLVLQWPYEGGDQGADGELVALGDGSFAVGAERDPRRIRFEGMTYGGKAAIAVFNGGRWFRSFEE
ncbi:MAG: serine hydrolase [Actinomycetota bacterium]|nr:serine hydrolase [Actinomycetota bacterium]